MKIARIWAQLVLISGFLIILSLILFIATGNRIYGWPGGAFLLIALGLTFTKLRCPHCGLRGFRPTWFSQKKMECPRCHKEFYYDDSRRILDGK